MGLLSLVVMKHRNSINLLRFGRSLFYNSSLILLSTYLYTCVQRMNKAEIFITKIEEEEEDKIR